MDSDVEKGLAHNAEGAAARQDYPLEKGKASVEVSNLIQHDMAEDGPLEDLESPKFLSAQKVPSRNQEQHTPAPPLLSPDLSTGSLIQDFEKELKALKVFSNTMTGKTMIEDIHVMNIRYLKSRVLKHHVIFQTGRTRKRDGEGNFVESVDGLAERYRPCDYILKHPMNSISVGRVNK
jgi:hypothetical protein